jgi:hypothetical protein
MSPEEPAEPPSAPAAAEVVPPEGGGRASTPAFAATGDPLGAVTPESLDLTGLPPLSFPSNPEREAQAAAAARRAARLRVELIGASVFLLVGILAAIVLRSITVAALAIVAVLVLLGYELLVSNFE